MSERNVRQYLGVHLEDQLNVGQIRGSSLKKLQGVLLDEEDEIPPDFPVTDPFYYWTFDNDFADDINGLILTDSENNGIELASHGFYGMKAVWDGVGSNYRRVNLSTQATSSLVVSFWMKDIHHQDGLNMSSIRVYNGDPQTLYTKIPSNTNNGDDWEEGVWHHYVCIMQSVLIENESSFWFRDGALYDVAEHINFPMVNSGIELFLNTPGEIDELAVWFNLDLDTTEKMNNFVSTLYNGGSGIVYRNGQWEVMEPV